LANREGSVPATAAQAQLSIGLLLQQQGDTDGARQQFDRTRRGFFGQPEALAATVFQADLMRRANPDEAVVLYKRALSQAGPADVYDNAWLPAEQLQTRLEGAIDDLADRGEFAKAVELAEGLVPLFARPISIERQANIERAWGTQLGLRAAKEKPQEAAVTEAEARQHWRQAGVLGRQLADL